MTRKRKGRAIHGFIVIDKPLGITSNAALQKVKHRLCAAKGGHTGALDPLATGVLPLCFGEATKFSQILLDADKEYVTKACLGIQTSTADSEGEVLVTRQIPEGLDLVALNQILESFRGAQKQTPTMFSALKHKGVPLYKLARQGIEVERKAREIFVHKLELVSWKNPFLELRVFCSKGTYIRNLVEDIGFKIGCGAHVAELKRIQSGPFQLQHAVSMTEFEAILSESGIEELIHPVDSAVSHYRKITLSDEQSRSLIHGQTVKLLGLGDGWTEHECLRLYSKEKGEFLGLGKFCSPGVLKSVRLLNPNALHCD